MAAQWQARTGEGAAVQVVARMSGLRLLNGSVVDAVERRDCELHYLRTLLATADSPQQLAATEVRHLQGLHMTMTTQCSAHSRPLFIMCHCLMLCAQKF